MLADSHASNLGRNPAFKYLVGGAALFIAGCSAFFSVSGLGLLFIGSATAVMVMAASLELGKLIAASFLYRYWSQISVPLRIYLTLAVLLLIGITSLGNYGYLARAYEQTNSQISLLQQQVQATQTEIDDTQHRIDASRTENGKTTDVGRQDIDRLQARITQANQSLDASLARVDERRKAAKDKRDSSVTLLQTRMSETAGVLKQGLDAEEAAVAKLNDRVAGLDRAVDTYTRQGGPGFFKSDGVRRGQELRDQQAPERTAIAQEITQHQAKEEQLRTQHASALDAITLQTGDVEQQYKKDLAALDTEAAGLRKTSADALADATQQLRALQTQGQSSAQAGDTQIEAMYQRVRTGNDELRRLREQIAATDIGSYRFVARAFNAGADDVVKWLILVLVLVFDPLAVALTVGFNMAMVRDRKLKTPSPFAGDLAPATIDASLEKDLAIADAAASGTRPRLKLPFAKPALYAFSFLLLLGLLAAGAFVGARAFRSSARTSHASLIPPDSFSVLTIRPAELQSATGQDKLADLLGNVAGRSATAALSDLLSSGFQQDANVYAFVKYPTDHGPDSGDHPVLLCGLVARVSDPRTAEAGLSRFYDVLTAALGKPSTGSGTTGNRAMIRFGRGRYLDPQGSFFTFGLTDHEAVVLIELEGDPQHPTVENEIRLCLGDTASAAPRAFGESAAKLPDRALSGEGPVSLWFSAQKCFAQMPKNAAAQARYQQLERHLGFDLLLTAKPSDSGALELVGDYVYAGDRFKPGSPSALDTLGHLGSPDTAGIPGRLMDRCAATVEFDGLIDGLRTTLAKPHGNGAAQVVVEKSIASDRAGRFVLTAHYDPQAGAPLVAALESLTQ